MHRNIILLVFLICILSISCKKKPSQESATASVSTIDQQDASGIPADFEVFFEQFHQDTAFQMSRISFPIRGKISNEDGTNSDYVYTKDKWVVHKPYDDMGGTFQRSYSETLGIITERIETVSAPYRMTRRFAKLGGEWNLIYYEPMGLYQN